MIKELLLSLAVAAASGVSFVGSPKRVDGTTRFYEGSYSASIKYYGTSNESISFSFPFAVREDVFIDENAQGDMNFTLREVSTDIAYNFNVAAGGDFWNHAGGFDWTLSFFVDDESYAQTIVNYYNNLTGYVSSMSGFSTVDSYPSVSASKALDSGHYRIEAYFSLAFGDIGDEQGEAVVNFEGAVTYNLTRNYINCSIASSPVLPATYTNQTAPIKPSYYVLMVSNAGGYGFTSESVTQSGGIVIRNFNLFDQYNNSGYYASLSFTAELPFNNCSITIKAFLPTYTITTNLERCSVSPAIPSSYSGTSFYGDYTFTANNGYGFNKNYTHWEVSNLFIDKVEFSNLLWGSFYSSVTLRLRASGGNSSISVTAIEYDEANYKLGYGEGREDGWQAGYDQGHADGEIAGNSYGVWNWLKQAALTTGEFLSIPLLPGFSIGGLLTAIAGLVIIWFFIKGFLFKS